MPWTETLNFNNDALNAESRDAFADVFGWQGPTDPRGGTKAAFRAWCLKDHVRNTVRMARGRADDANRNSRIGEPDIG